MAQDKDKWWAVVKMIMNLQVSKMRGILRLAEELSASEEQLSSMNSVSPAVIYSCLGQDKFPAPCSLWRMDRNSQPHETSKIAVLCIFIIRF